MGAVVSDGSRLFMKGDEFNMTLQQILYVLIISRLQ